MQVDALECMSLLCKVVFLFQKLKGFQKADRHQKAPLVLKKERCVLDNLSHPSWRAAS